MMVPVYLTEIASNEDNDQQKADSANPTKICPVNGCNDKNQYNSGNT